MIMSICKRCADFKYCLNEAKKATTALNNTAFGSRIDRIDAVTIAYETSSKYLSKARAAWELMCTCNYQIVEA